MATWATQFYQPTLATLTLAFRALEVRVPPPVRVAWKDGFVFRYAERTVHQAIIQKLARTISGLHAIRILLNQGLFQEQGVIQRALDEIGEDITFLCFGVIYQEETRRHQEYLDYFYAEEFHDPSDVIGAHKSRGMVSRDKIRTYINGKLGSDSSRANIASKIVTKAYSGFVHAASPHIMDMCGGYTPRFDIGGEFAELRKEEHAEDALNYFFRALLSMAIAAKAFGDDVLFLKIKESAAELEAKMLTREARPCHKAAGPLTKFL